MNKGENQHRWLGLKSYQEDDASVFFGRESEAEQLFRMVQRETLTTIFAPSGTGKTSLLCAGLFPKLREAGFLPLHLRLQHGVPDIDHGKWLREEIEKAIQKEGLEISSIVPPQTDPEQELLWEYLHRIEIWGPGDVLLTPVLIFDQFEEIFTVGSDRPETEYFLGSLASIVEKRMPTELRKRLELEKIKSTIPVGIQGFKIVLSLREDFVAQLDDLRKKMPSVMHNRYPLHMLTGEQAMEVVLGPGKGIVSKTVAEKIVRIVALADSFGNGETTDFAKLTVEPNLLSLVCDELDQQRIQKGEDSIAIDGLKDSSKGILRRFYKESFKDLEPSARVFVEDQLLTSTGYRKSQPLDDATDGGLGEHAQQHLINRHVLRILDRKDMPHLELTHDLLAGVVKESRDVRHETAKIEEARRKQRKKLMVLGLTSSVSILLMVFFVFMTIRAQKAEKMAEANQKIAEKNQQKTEEIIDFMANDLYDRLQPIGRTDILDEVALKVQSHLEQEVDEQNQSNLSIHTRSKALNKFANILARRGDIFEALETHQKSAAILERFLENRSLKGVPLAEMQHSLANTKLDQAALMGEWVSPASADAKASQAATFLAANLDENIPEETKDKREELRKRLKLIEARIHLIRHNSFEAQEILTAFVGPQSPDDHDPDIHQALSQSYDLVGDFPKALSHLRMALRRINKLHLESPGNDHFLYRKAGILKSLGNLHLQIRDFEGARDKLEPALSIVNGKLQQSKEATGDNQKNQWKYLATDISLTLCKLWVLKAKDTEGTIDPSKNTAIKIAGENLAIAQTWRKTTWEKDKQPSLLLRHLYGKIYEQEADYYLAIDEVEKALQCYQKAKDLVIRDGESATMSQQLKLARYEQLIGSTQETYFNQSLSPRALMTAIELYGNIAEEDPLNLGVLGSLADVLQQLSLAYNRRGQIEQSILRQQEAVQYLQAVANFQGSDAVYIRALIDARSKLGDLFSDSDAKIEAKMEFSFCSRAALQYLQPHDFLRVSDRLRAADALYKEGLVSVEFSEIYRTMKAASNFGSKEATDWLVENFAESLESKDVEDLKQLSDRQDRRPFLLPCQFIDELQTGDGSEVIRHVVAEVLIAAPSRDGTNYFTPLDMEAERLRRDFRLEIEPKVAREINQRHSLAGKKELGLLSYADLTDNSGANGRFQNRNSQEIHPVKPLSPVHSVYPKRAPTVIGNECTLSWEYLGTGNELRQFQLQIGDTENFDSDNVRVIQVSGTRTRLDFKKANLIHLKNSPLYWRVKQVPKFSNPASIPDVNRWSITREFEIYESTWERIRRTNELRVGISQFEGDLLELESTDAHYTGFDGEVLKKIRDEVKRRLNEERTELTRNDLVGTDRFPDPNELQLKHFTYGWDGMFEAVGRNEVDFILSIITRTKEREERFGIRFSEPYYETQLAFVYADLDDGKGSLEKDPNPMARLRKIKLAANRGFRGQEVGKMITSEPILAVDANLPQLLGTVRNKEAVGALTDHAFVIKQRQTDAAVMESLNVFTLNRSHYRKLWELEYSQTTPDQEVLAKLAEMESDYGTAEWEQYAAGVNANQNNDFINHLNEIILDLRKSGELGRFCDQANLPRPKRLLGEHQIPEEQRNLADVVPLYPIDVLSWDQRNSIPSIIKGDRVKIRWEPLDSDEAPAYRFQLSDSRDFSPHSILVDQVLDEPTITINRSDHSKAKGVLFWRAKQLPPGINTPVEDVFPADRWCAPVEFHFYADTIEQAEATGMLKVGVAVTNGFSVYRDQKQRGELTGFDIEIVKYVSAYIAKKIEKPDLKLDWVSMQFATLFPMVQNHQIDLAISGISFIKEREDKYDLKFSRSYCRTRQAAIWLAKANAETVSDLKGESFVVFKETRARKMVDHFKPGKIQSTKSHPKAFLLEKLRSGQANATITDYPAALKLLQDQPDSSIFRVAPIMKSDFDDESIPEEFFLDKYAIPVAKSDARLHRLINEALTQLATVDLDRLKEIFQAHGVPLPKGLTLPPYELE